MRHIAKRVRLIVLCVMAWGPLTQLAVGATRIVEVEGLTEYRLDNGLRVVLAPDASQQTTSVNITYLVGSRMEGAGETGMAHLLEHLVFKGTPNHPNIYQELTRRGMRSNGTTWLDRTNYFETFAASPEHLEWALRMEADRMVNSFMSEKDLASEMTVVRNEMERGENDIPRMLSLLVLDAAYRWHPYGRATIGARSDVENVPIDRLRSFYRKYYQPDNAVLVVAGRFDAAQTLAWIERDFGAIARPTRVLNPIYTVEPPQEGARRVELSRIGESRHLMLAYHVPPALHADIPALQVLRELLDATPGGRLHEALVKPGHATGVWGWLMYAFDPSYMMFGADLRKESDPGRATALLLEQIESRAAGPVSEAELTRARKAIRARLDAQLADASSFGIALSQSIAVGDWRQFFWLRDRIGHVSAADVQRVARRYLQAANRTLGEFIPQDAPAAVAIEGRQDLSAAFSALPAVSSLTAGEDFDSSPAGLDARTRRARLDNGLEIALLPKKTRGERVRLNLSLRLGTPESMSGKGLLTELTAGQLLAGTARRDRTQIASLVESMEGRVTTSGSGQTITLTMETRRPHLPAMLDLLREVLRESRFPDEELQRVLRTRIAALRAAEFDPDALASRALARHLTPWQEDDPRYRVDAREFEARAKGVNGERLREFWTDFGGADHGWLSVVGDFDADQMLTLLRERFGDWRSAQPYSSLPDATQSVSPETRLIDVRDKQNAVLRGGARLPVGERSTDYPAVMTATHLLGGGFLNSRLAQRLRQRDGVSYNVSASYAANAGSAYGMLSIGAIYAPQNRTRVEQAVREELQRVAREGFTAEELEMARSALLQSARVRRASDANLAAELTRNLRLKRDFGHDARLETKLASLTLEELNAVARRHFDPAGVSLVFAGSFSAPPAATREGEPMKSVATTTDAQ